MPDVLDLGLVDRVEQVTDEEAIEIARRLAREEGILAGISCGAAMAVALALAKEKEFAGKTIVVDTARLGRALPLVGPLRGNYIDRNAADWGLPGIRRTSEKEDVQ